MDDENKRALIKVGWGERKPVTTSHLIVDKFQQFVGVGALGDL